MSTTKHIRTTFLEFFARHDHTIMPSSPLVPHNDPTLMFTNAGMNQFKDIFTGRESAPTPPRATTSQKVVRAGGKHNDLDNVGYTARHHTFFEMLGNFSFGDYFKEQAIVLAWELLTKDYALNPDKLFITVYHTDDDAFDYWKKVTGFDDARIIRVPTKDNFWEMGPTGPCGPCSEIFYDHGEGVAEGKWALDNAGNDFFGDRFIEIWNLVFMQYEQVDSNTRIDLPKPSVDTGMGLERMAAVIQGQHDNYAIDLFQHLIGTSEHLTQTKAQGEHAASHKVIADHLRSSCFLIADGVLPSNEGRGYVLRRIMRRGMRHAHMLGATEPLMHRLVPSLLNEMGEAYPELLRAEALITQTLKSEEERFKKTLGRGLKLLDEEMERLNAGDKLTGATAFKLYDTYGFPLDLTEDILRGKGMQVDQTGFDAAMAEQKQRARDAWKGSGEAGIETLWFDIKEEVGATEFLGYGQSEAQGNILALVKDGKKMMKLKAGDTGYIVTNQTPFYGESGGQVGDTGSAYKDENNFALITDTQKPLEDFHVHKVEVKQGELVQNDTITLAIDELRRSKIRSNHSATHILHESLKRHLGEHIAQKGSLVDDEKLRFDISHPEQITREELAAIESEVNAVIRQNTEVRTKLMNKDEAIEAGAKAMFGEKYADEVRVLTMGVDDGHGYDNEEANPVPMAKGEATSYSVELCGGTHVSHTGDIGVFKIVSESAIAAGVRRIEALTGAAAFAYLAERDTQLRELALTANVKPEELNERLFSLLDEKKQLEKNIAELKKQIALGGGSSNAVEKEMLGDIGFIGKAFDGMEAKELRPIAQEFLKQLESGVVVVASNFEGKGSVVVAISDDKANSIDAPTLVRQAAEVMGGKGGGGKPHLAQAGGPDGAKATEAIRVLKEQLNNLCLH